eukprot:TRINITY_DN4218_c0_g2_i1.p2 TRINITY_DN4218_c0_g2~~TRINITY_DN4218_c0_g2_i1.p2  ORF type:complete len:112 (-),score=44.26 TRINITY_DN4218_c0_g2_i1:653-988(-)
MVAKLLAKLDVTEEEFVAVCTKASKDKKNKKDIRTLLSGTDFKLFREVMHEENKKLNDEAYEALKHQQALEAAKQKEREMQRQREGLTDKEQEELNVAIQESIELEVQLCG